MIKALSIRQPWASIIAAGEKLIENRSGTTHYRGPLAIHASKGWCHDDGLDPRVRAHYGRRPLQRDFDDGHLGAIIALAQLVDCHLAEPDPPCCAPWGDLVHRSPRRGLVPAHHLVLADVVPVDPTLRIDGQLGLWRVPDRIADQLADLVPEAR